jgi:hypothetical protein
MPSKCDLNMMKETECEDSGYWDNKRWQKHDWD